MRPGPPATLSLFPLPKNKTKASLCDFETEGKGVQLVGSKGRLVCACGGGSYRRRRCARCPRPREERSRRGIREAGTQSIRGGGGKERARARWSGASGASDGLRIREEGVQGEGLQVLHGVRAHAQAMDVARFNRSEPRAHLESGQGAPARALHARNSLPAPRRRHQRRRRQERITEEAITRRPRRWTRRARPPRDP